MSGASSINSAMSHQALPSFTGSFNVVLSADGKQAECGHVFVFIPLLRRLVGVFDWSFVAVNAREKL